MPKYILYPGCSLHRMARPYLDSTLALCELLGIELEEVQDWNCCGATEYIAVHHLASYALVGRNLALAAQKVDDTHTVVAACSACYLNLAKTDSYMRQDARLNQQVNEALAAGGLQYIPGSVRVRHLLDVIVNDVGLEHVASSVVRSLKGLRVAPYYGCMIARPDRENRWDNVEHPVAMDRLLKTLGAEVIDFPLKTHCCGGHMTQINLSVAYELIRRLIHGADQYRADVISTLCPICQLNLDAYQGEVNRHFHTSYEMPVLYFTQLMGLAFGLEPETLGIGKEFVAAGPALSHIGVEAVINEGAHATTAVRAGSRKKEKEGLPMPRMPIHEEKSP
ncbi:MAG: CoB--CoM heterodisulfide reductase iron-sulfur subunit B family protein [Anaerolineae bacterium]|nr:CoB--CoM heterodisulfide reductase iron-sulfur subunit B family protein [Anaerolineae bacterium]